MSDSASIPGGLEDRIERIKDRIDDRIERIEDRIDDRIERIRDRVDDRIERTEDLTDNIFPGGLDNFNDAFNKPGGPPSDIYDFFATENSPFFDPDPFG